MFELSGKISSTDLAMLLARRFWNFVGFWKTTFRACAALAMFIFDEVLLLVPFLEGVFVGSRVPIMNFIRICDTLLRGHSPVSILLSFRHVMIPISTNL